MRTYIAVIEHKTGYVMMSGPDQKHLRSRVAEYCKDNWEGDEPLSGDETDDEVIAAYFDDSSENFLLEGEDNE